MESSLFKYCPRPLPPPQTETTLEGADLSEILEAVALPDRLYLNTTSRVKCQILCSVHCFISY